MPRPYSGNHANPLAGRFSIVENFHGCKKQVLYLYLGKTVSKMYVRKTFGAWMARTLIQAGILGTVWLLTGWTGAPDGEKPVTKIRALTDPVFLHSPAAWVDSVMATLTPEQRIAQMIMVAA
jgi:hypothetical protein